MVFVPCFVILLIYGCPRAATAIFLLAALTDGLDGLIARKLNQRTPLGSFLDPMADKILLTAAFITLTIHSVPVALHIPVWLTILTISRDLLIAVAVIIIHMHTGHSRFPPSMQGKCTTVLQLVLVGICLLAGFEIKMAETLFPFAVYATLFFTVSSGLHYFYRSVKIISSYQDLGNAENRNKNS
jgi:cardiolipin synthase